MKNGSYDKSSYGTCYSTNILGGGNLLVRQNFEEWQRGKDYYVRFEKINPSKPNVKVQIKTLKTGKVISKFGKYGYNPETKKYNVWINWKGNKINITELLN